MSGFNPKWIIGKTVASVDMRPVPNSPYCQPPLKHNPIIRFTDGSFIHFLTEESDGEYGTDILYGRAPR